MSLLLTDEEKVRVRHHLGCGQQMTSFKSASGRVRWKCRACVARKMREWRQTDVGGASVKKTQTKWLAKNTSYERERARRRYKNDSKYRARTRASSIKWSKKNPAYYALAAHNRRALAAKAGRMVTREQWDVIVEVYRCRCAYCGAKAKLTVDHVVALSKGGTHAPANLAPACKSCNSKKGTRDLDQLTTEVQTRFAMVQARALPFIALEMRLLS